MRQQRTYEGVILDLTYDDANAALDWLTRVFGFEERARYVDKDGAVRQAEMYIGDTDCWLDGRGPGWWDKVGHGPERYVLVWIDDVDAFYDRVIAAGVACEPPDDRDYDVRQLIVQDLEGYHWCFMKRLGTGYVQRIPTEEGGLREILASDA